MWSLIAVLTALTLFLLSLALTFATGGAAPKILGKNVFLVETDAFSLLKSGTAIVTEEVAPEEITAGNIVIFKLTDAPALGEIQSSSMSEGVYSFEVIDEKSAPATVSQGQIIGKAMMFSDFLGGAIVFVRSPVGLLLIAVLPCLIIIGIELYKAMNSRKSKPVAPVKKQEEIPSYVPRPKLQPAAANAYKAAQQAQPVEPLTKSDDSPLFVSPMNRRRAEAPAQSPAAPLSQERLNAAIAATNAERRKREQLKTQLESAAEVKRSTTATFDKPKPSGTESRSYRTIIDEKPGAADAVKIKKGPDDGDRTVKQFTPRTASRRSLSTTATIPRLDEILADENENKRYNVDDILEKYGNSKKS